MKIEKVKRNCNKNGYPINGHLYQQTRRINKLDEVGRQDNHDWWVSVLSDFGIDGCPDDFPKHFKRVCYCKKYLCKSKGGGE